MGRGIPVSAETRLTFGPNVGLVLEIPPDEEARLNELARKIGGDKADVFQRALGLLTIAVEAKERGKRIGIVNSEGRLETEITGL